MKQLALACLVASIALASVGCKKDAAVVAAEPVVNVLVFDQYVPPEVLTDFKKETGLEVRLSNVASNEELLQKLVAGKGTADYDVVSASDYMVKRLADQGLLRKLDRAALANFGNLDPAFLGKSFDPKNEYSVPFFWGLTGIGYNKKTVGTVDSWAALFDPKFGKQIQMLEDPREMLAAALRKAGKGVNERDPAALDQAKADLKKQFPLVKVYNTDTPYKNLAGDEVALAQGFNGEFAKVIAKRPDELAFVIPKEGGTLWIDNLLVPASARRPANAQRFIDYLLRHDVAAKLANFAAYGSPNKAARAQIDPARLKNEIIYPPADVLARCQVMEDLGAANKMADTLMEDVKGKD